MPPDLANWIALASTFTLNRYRSRLAEVIGNVGNDLDHTPLELVFPPAADLNAPPSDRVETTISRIVRDTALANWVKRNHNHRCQICGGSVLLADGSCYAEGHHLQPLGKPHNGPDRAENVVCLCPNHHAACDLEALRLETHMLRQAGAHKVGQRFIDYHNEVIFRG
ncbi:MAG: hypothetical protein M3552_10930 [Planctomycetota bacterium]|nr:hypothetical protein [Planctomycetota bacterium]